MRRACIVAIVSIAVAMTAKAEEEPAPHGLGLLAGRVGDEAARERLRAGLGDPRPWVRGAAVRVINVSGVGELVPAVASVLASESDAGAASEMVRFLTAVNHPELDTVVMEAARRVGPAVHASLADGLGRRGAAAAAQIPALRALGIDEHAWSVFYPLATAGAGSGAGPLGTAILKEGDVSAWRQLLAAVRRAEGHLDQDLAVAGIRAEAPGIRAETYWHLAFVFDASKPPKEGLLASLRETPEAGEGPPSNVAAALAFEVLQRRLGRPPRMKLQTLDLGGASPRIPVALDVVRTKRVASVLDKTERKTLGVVLFHSEDALEGLPDVPPGGGSRAASGYSRIETAREFPARYVADVFQAAGCAIKGWDRVLGGEVSYGADGRPRSLGQLPDGEASKECQEAVRALLVSTLAPLGIPSRAGEKALLLVPDQPAYLDCLDATATESSGASRVDTLDPPGGSSGGQIKEPRKVRDVRPRYPQAAKVRRVQGVVILEASISRSGCIHGVSLLLGRDSDLDLEAMRVVSGWGYTPTLLNGQPVPVLMTVTVNFKLN